MSAPPTQALQAVRGQIEEAVRRAGRDPDTVRLIAMSKTFGESDVVPVLEAGQRLFGENRVQEAKAKWPDLKARYPGVELHLVGPLQTNKVRDAVRLFDAIHTLDRPKLAEAIAGEMAKQRRQLKLLVEVNTGAEPQKAGVMAKETKDFVAYCREQLKLPIAGLMCIPPLDEAAGVHFAFLAKLAGELQLPELSMGMSADFAQAVVFGATYVRVGTAIFGERSPRE